jgi:hypothetical protein
MSRTHQERLLKNGFLLRVINGWLMPGRPDNVEDEHGMVHLILAILRGLPPAPIKTQWCLSPEQSLSTHAGSWTVPKQLVVRTPKARNKITNLPHGTSLFDLRANLPTGRDREVLEEMQVFLPSALSSNAQYISSPAIPRMSAQYC